MARGERTGYTNLSIDQGLADEARSLRAACPPGLWASERAFLHELLRRGLLSLARDLGPAGTDVGEPPRLTGRAPRRRAKGGRSR